MKPLPLPAALLIMLAAAGCGEKPRTDTPLRVSAIGTRAAPGDPSATPLDTARRALMGATAQGLVAFDAAGQIVPGLAESWLVTDGGRSYIFRIRDAEWPDGTPVTTDEVVSVVKRAYAPASRNVLAPFLQVIDDVVAMTDRVIEVRLSRPRPDLLKLFAQPELAIFRLDSMGGSGPFRVKPQSGRGALLVPAFDPARTDDEDADAPTPGDYVELRGGRAALAIARYKNGRADLVLGGTFADWPVAMVANIDASAIRIDPAAGLFGLAVTDRNEFLADPANRAAIAMAIDRAELLRRFRPDWAPIETLLPAQLDSATAPAAPAWSALTLDQRREEARARVASWERAHPGTLAIRVALPPGQGATLVWNGVARSLIAIGVQPVRVGTGDDADLRLIDAVAPYDSARWYLAMACRRCGDDVATLIDAARDAPTLDARAHRIAEADTALAADAAYIPLAQPLRWSIVTTRITAWQGNARAWHPLNHLRTEGD